MLHRNYLIAFILTTGLAILTLFSCKKDKTNDTTPTNTEKATVTMRLTDDPGDYDAVLIDIEQIEVKMENSSSVMLTPLRPGVYDLMRLRNGKDTILVTAGLNPGKIEQIRLHLGPNSSVIVDGLVYPLNTPSAQESGLKLNLHQTFEAGTTYQLWIDFDAGKSVVKTGNGKYNLKPVIRAYTTATDGRISGYVLPGAAFATVYAQNGTDTYAAIPDDHGYYLITGLPEGSYTVTFDASVLTYTDITLNNINVKYGQTTDLGTVVLVP